MTPAEFGALVMVYCGALGGSVTSWGRTTAHNEAVHGVNGSAHRFWLGADVVYDEAVAESTARMMAGRLNLRVIRESDHDHVQPASWPPGQRMEPLTPLERWVRLARDVGFPIAVAVYLLVRLDLLIRQNTEALWALTIAVERLTKGQ